MPNSPIPAAGEAMSADGRPGLSSGHVDDLRVDANHLHQLLNIGVEVLVGVRRGVDEAADAELARLDALFWVARDLARKLRDDLEEGT